MVICNIIINEKPDAIIQKYQDVPFVNIVNKHWKLIEGKPTLIYGYKFAKELYPEIQLDQWYIRKDLFWTFNEHEASGKIPENWTDIFVREMVGFFLHSRQNNIDVIFDHKNFDLKSFVSKVGEWPLVHSGKHEIYVAEIGDYDKDVIVHSFQMDNLKYADLDPEKFFYDLISGFESECLVFSTAEIDLTRLKNSPLSFQDIIQASNNEILSFQEIVSTFSPYVTEFTKEMVLTYFMRHELYSKRLFTSFI